MFVAELKQGLQRPQQRGFLAFTQLSSRLVTLPPSFITITISAMSILYQQWRLCLHPGFFVSSQGGNASPSPLISDECRSVLIRLLWYLEDSLLQLCDRAQKCPLHSKAFFLCSFQRQTECFTFKTSRKQQSCFRTDLKAATYKVLCIALWHVRTEIVFVFN